MLFEALAHARSACDVGEDGRVDSDGQDNQGDADDSEEERGGEEEAEVEAYVADPQELLQHC